MYKILFVCLGNICRSPYGEGAMRARIASGNLEDKIFVDSAGVQGYHTGDSPDDRACHVAMERGCTLDGITARKITKNDFNEFDLILAMDFSHKRSLENLKPKNSKAQISLLLDFAENPPQREVPDPYYGGVGDFKYAFDLIEMGVDGVMEYVCKKI